MGAGTGDEAPTAGGGARTTEGGPCSAHPENNAQSTARAAPQRPFSISIPPSAKCRSSIGTMPSVYGAKNDLYLVSVSLSP